VLTCSHAYEWVLSHTWLSHVTHMNASCYTELAEIMGLPPFSRFFEPHIMFVRLFYEREHLYISLATEGTHVIGLFEPRITFVLFVQKRHDYVVRLLMPLFYQRGRPCNISLWTTHHVCAAMWHKRPDHVVHLLMLLFYKRGRPCNRSLRTTHHVCAALLQRDLIM